MTVIVIPCFAFTRAIYRPALQFKEDGYIIKQLYDATLPDFSLRVDGGLILPGMPEDAAMVEDGWKQEQEG